MTLKKIEVGIPKQLEPFLINVALQEFEGNISKYVRHLILTDLVNRTAITHMEAQLARELEL